MPTDDYEYLLLWGVLFPISCLLPGMALGVSLTCAYLVGSRQSPCCACHIPSFFFLACFDHISVVVAVVVLVVVVVLVLLLACA